MKHKKTGRKFSRIRKQRRALLKTLLGSFIMAEKITTTEAKAKELKSLFENIAGKVKKLKNNKALLIRELKKSLPEKSAMKLNGDFANRFNKRNSGFTRIMKIRPRKSDGAKMAVIEFV